MYSHELMLAKCTAGHCVREASRSLSRRPIKKFFLSRSLCSRRHSVLYWIPLEGPLPLMHLSTADSNNLLYSVQVERIKC